jgi:hypothetical protein
MREIVGITGPAAPPTGNVNWLALTVLAVLIGGALGVFVLDPGAVIAWCIHTWWLIP